MGWRPAFLRGICVFVLGLNLVANSAQSKSGSLDIHRAGTIKAILAKLKSIEDLDDPRSLEHIRHFHFEEVAQTLLSRLQFEMEKARDGEFSKMHPGVVHSCLVGLHEMISQTHARQIKEIREMAVAAYGELGTRDEMKVAFHEKVEPWLKKITSRSRYRKSHLPRLLDITDGVDPTGQLHRELLGQDRWDIKEQKAFEKELDRLSAIRQEMEEGLIEQPEVIALWEDYLLNDYLKRGQREKPDMMYLMGHPGTGKDTSVAVALAAIHKDPKAHLKHLYRTPLIQSKEDLMQLTGSTPGLVSSGNLSPWIRFAVAHSGGRYYIEPEEKNNEIRYMVMENPSWKPNVRREDLNEGEYLPEDGVIFINEFHNWSKAAKDYFFKEFGESGRIVIGDPGSSGLSEIFVPVRIVIATNEGIELLSPRDDDGSRMGPSLSHEELKERHDFYKDDEEAKRKCLIQGRNRKNGRQEHAEKSTGMSEENANRIPAHAMILMNPTSPEGLRKIIRIKLQMLADVFEKQNAPLGVVRFSFSNELVDFIQKFHFNAEDMARPMESKIFALIERSVLHLVRERKLRPLPDEVRKITVDIKPNKDRAMDLVLKSPSFPQGELRTEIPSTRKRVLPLISDAEIDRLIQIPQKMGEQVFGVEPVLNWLGRAILARADDFNRIRSGQSNKATLAFGFFGISSAGKTRSAKVLAKELFGDESRYVEFQMGNVRSEEELRRLILGGFDSENNVIRSEFMKAHDKLGGRMVLVLDEFTNMEPYLQKLLFNFFREAKVKFGDEMLSMGGVVSVLTGNIGEEWYSGIPRDAPESEQIAALAEVYQKATTKPGFMRNTLRAKFLEALLNRIGSDNIFFYPPLNFEAIRRLTQMFLLQSLKELKGSESTRGWEVGFANSQDYLNILANLEKEGFKVWEQGASLEHYVGRYFQEELKVLLIREKVTQGSRIHLRMGESVESTFKVAGQLVIDVQVEGQEEPLRLRLKRKLKESDPVISDDSRVLTAFHEIGHNFMRRALLPNWFEDVLVTVIPGVTDIDGEWLRYLGLAEYEQLISAEVTREFVIRNMAVLLAGTVAQEYVTVGQQHDAGKSNDIMRASAFARRAILEWGLSDRWGYSAAPDENVEHYVATLSSERRTILEEEIASWIQEAKNLAHRYIDTNFEKLFLPLSLRLAEEGEIEARGLKEFYSQHPIQEPPQELRRPPALAWAQRSLSNLASSTLKAFRSPDAPRPVDGVLRRADFKPAKVAKIEDIIEERQKIEWAKVKTPEDLPVFESFGKKAKAKRKGKNPCATSLEQ